jgi:hypothetical protein
MDAFKVPFLRQRYYRPDLCCDGETGHTSAANKEEGKTNLTSGSYFSPINSLATLFHMNLVSSYLVLLLGRSPSAWIDGSSLCAPQLEKHGIKDKYPTTLFTYCKYICCKMRK